MRLFVWNVNGLGPTLRNIVLEHGGLSGLFERYGADVVCFQETKQQEDKIDRKTACLEGYESFWACSQSRKGYSGVCTWVSRKYSPVEAAIDFLGNADEDFGKEGRIVLTDLKAFVLINVYVPNAGDPPKRLRLDTKLRFLSKLNTKLLSLKEEGRAVLVVGDFNVAVSASDLHPTFKLEEIYTPEEISSFQDILKNHMDVWRVLHPHEDRTFTVFNEKKSYRDSNKGLRIDYALATPEVMKKVLSCNVVDTPKKWSDHKALLLELDDIPAIASHRPCPLSSVVKFKKQRTLVSMFGTPKRKSESDSGTCSKQKRKGNEGTRT